jgi:hypothetical protein
VKWALARLNCAGSGEADVESYELQISEAGAAFGSSTSFASTESGAQFSDLGEGVTYQFRLRANREGLSSSWTTSETVTTLESVPTFVQPQAPIIYAEASDSTTAYITWNQSEAVDYFEVQCVEEGCEPMLLEPFGEDALEVELAGLTPETTYTFRIRSVRNNIASNWVTSNAIETPAVPEEEALSPAHYWSMDEALNGIAVDSGYGALDLDTSEGEAGVGVGSSVNSSLLLTGQHDGVHIPDTPTINCEIVSAQTLSLWIKLDSSSATKTSVIYEQGGFWRGLNLIIDKGWLQASGWNRPAKESDWHGTTLSGGRVPTGEWVHIALVLNAGPEVMENGLILYLNGQQVDTGAASQLWPHSNKMGLGQIQQDTVYRDRSIRKLNPLQAELDEFSIWQAALCPEEIEALVLSYYE